MPCRSPPVRLLRSANGRSRPPDGSRDSQPPGRPADRISPKESRTDPRTAPHAGGAYARGRSDPGIPSRRGVPSGRHLRPSTIAPSGSLTPSPLCTRSTCPRGRGGRGGFDNGDSSRANPTVSPNPKLCPGLPAFAGRCFDTTPAPRRRAHSGIRGVLLHPIRSRPIHKYQRREHPDKLLPSESTRTVSSYVNRKGSATDSLSRWPPEPTRSPGSPPCPPNPGRATTPSSM